MKFDDLKTQLRTKLKAGYGSINFKAAAEDIKKRKEILKNLDQEKRRLDENLRTTVFLRKRALNHLIDFN